MTADGKTPDVLTEADRQTIKQWKPHLLAIAAYRPPEEPYAMP